MVRDSEPCVGPLECSHYFTQGSSPALMFHPWNAHAQCAMHHLNHHSRRERFYNHWMVRNMRSRLEFIEARRYRYIKYDVLTLREIARMCNEDRLDDLAEYINGRLG